jgi:hypothetical protein
MASRICLQVGVCSHLSSTKKGVLLQAAQKRPGALLILADAAGTEFRKVVSDRMVG